jgi:hypothetical protein
LIQKAQVEQKKTIELAEQDRAIAIAEKSVLNLKPRRWQIRLAQPQ